MAYPEVIRYLESFVNYEKKSHYHYKRSFELGRIKELLEILGNPQGAFKCIHVAGTKGKGSTCAFIAYILREAGYKTGLYTSPHLSDFRERIRILKPVTRNQLPETRDFEGMISKQSLSRLAWRLKPTIDKFNKNSKYGPLTFFEVYTALSLVYFKEKKADFVVLETGLGGRLDATNVVNPLVCAITPISLEHTQLLGNTIAKIAREKAGIIKKRHAPCAMRHALAVIMAPQAKEAREVAVNRCKTTGARLYEVGKDIIYKIKNEKLKIKNRIQKFEIQGIINKYKNLRIKLIGEHQLVNVAAAIGALEALQFHGIKINAASIRKGIYNTLWPGRCEVIGKRPWVVLDGAQNVASAKALKETIGKSFKYKRLILVLGACQDKDIKGICNELFPMADEVILTKANSPRAAEPELIKEIVLRHAPCAMRKIVKTKDVQEAIEKTLTLANKEDLILITGSLFVVGEARDAINKGSFYSPY